jgi:hypothetical protein
MRSRIHKHASASLTSFTGFRIFTLLLRKVFNDRAPLDPILHRFRMKRTVQPLESRRDETGQVDPRTKHPHSEEGNHDRTQA